MFTKNVVGWFGIWLNRTPTAPVVSENKPGPVTSIESGLGTL